MCEYAVSCDGGGLGRANVQHQDIRSILEQSAYPGVGLAGDQSKSRSGSGEPDQTLCSDFRRGTPDCHATDLGEDPGQGGGPQPCRVVSCATQVQDEVTRAQTDVTERMHGPGGCLGTNLFQLGKGGSGLGGWRTG